VDPLEDVELFVCVEPGVADHLAHYVPVFLLHVARVILLVSPAPSKRDGIALAVAFEMSVDELTSVVGIYAKDGEGE